jgi:NADH-quinone oxidoreductase subunit I
MGLEKFKDRNIGIQNYKTVKHEAFPKNNSEKFIRVIKRMVKGELFVGLCVTFKAMYRALFKNEMHTVKYPFEKLPISPRYRAIHKMLRLLESGHYRCIGCGLCEKICPANCIKIDTSYNEDQRKEVNEYTINFGRCIFCGYCAEVCPELAIVHGNRYETASQQRASFSIFEDMLTPKDALSSQKEYPGFGSVSPNADNNVKKTPLAY